MQRITATLIVTLSLTGPAAAGCIGPVIMGECQGQSVQWDTHEPRYAEPQPAPPGTYWDKRSLPMDQQQPGAVNPFTGQDAHDSDWYSNRRNRR